LLSRIALALRDHHGGDLPADDVLESVLHEGSLTAAKLTR
jgi:hypothetical protein